MSFVKYTAPAPPPSPQIRVTATAIQFTAEGQEKLRQITPHLLTSNHVYLWFNSESNEVAVTPAKSADRDSFTVKGNKIQAKAFLEHAQLDENSIVPGQVAILEQYEDGIKFSLGTKGGPQTPVAPPVKRRRRRRTNGVLGAAIPTADQTAHSNTDHPNTEEQLAISSNGRM